jgi:predicted nucleic acid-binding protein
VDFLDSNIWFYVFADSQSLTKHERARRLIAEEDIAISQQIVSEVCNALRSKKLVDESEIKVIIRSFYNRYDPLVLDARDLIDASDLRERFNFSYWDSLIVEAALKAEASILYSEDMQDGLTIRDRLTIRNPFR